MAWENQATEKQRRYIDALQEQLGRIPKDFARITKRQAKTLIDDLLEELAAMEKADGVQS